MNPIRNHERWATIEGFGRYQVSDFGRVRSTIRAGRILKPFLNGGKNANRRYQQVTLMADNGKSSKRALVHRLVASAFCRRPPSANEVTHIDGDKLNNNSENLEWCTTQQNSHHARDVLGFRGEKQSNNILSEDEAAFIKAFKDVTATEQKYLATVFGVSYSAVRDIQKGRTWRHLP